MRSRLVLVVAAAVLVAAALAAAALSTRAGRRAGPGSFTVVAAESFWGSIAAQLAGELLNLGRRHCLLVRECGQAVP